MRAYASTLFAVLDRLVAFPGIGRRREDLAPGLLSHPAEQHVIVYRVTADELVIVRMVHHRRDLPAGFGD